jgi:PTH1 family peptidyl-tRNA hydrolase
MYLIAGLGNPDHKYKNNRHNIGFLIIDEIVKNLINTSNINKKSFNSITTKSNNTIFSKPQTYMNESGLSIYSIKEFYDISTQNIIIVHDDLDLPFGTIRFKCGGGHGGHNGLRSIDKHIGKDYLRVRFGIGKPEDKADVANYVLSDFSVAQKKDLVDLISHCVEAIEKLQTNNLQFVQSNYTKKI